MTTKQKVGVGIGAFALFVAGFAVGGGSEEAAPPVTITETETVTEQEIVSETPQACIEALDYASEAITKSSEVFAAIGQGDFSGAAGLADDFSTWATGNTDAMALAAGACRAGA